MTGSSIFNYVHQSDHAEIAEQLGLCLADGQTSPPPTDEPTGSNNPDVSSVMSLNGSSYKGYERAFCVRMKSTLTKRGCHFKSSGYRVVLLLCHLRPQHNFSNAKKSTQQILGMTALAVALPPPSLHEIRLECDMFVTRVNFDFRISHAEPKITELLDYTPEELVGESLYNLCHGEDAAKLKKCHIDLISQGQVLTHYYRLLNKNGGYTWIQTCATVVCSAKNNDEQHIVCVNYVVSGRENLGALLDQCQLGIKREPTATFKTDSDPKSAGSGECSDDKTGIDGKASELSMNSSSHETSHKVETRGDDVALSCASQKRGRKRKLKYEAKDGDAIDSTSSPISGDTPSDISVKDLVNVMSKHLPKTSDENSVGFRTDATHLRHQQSINGNREQVNNLSHQSPTMPATALLRQLYANRESVIRATTRPANYMYADGSQQHSLPTPPNDSYDSYLRKSSEGFSHLASNYSGGYSSMDYGMTPPSSVSPRDLTHHKNYDYTNPPPAASDGRMQYPTDSHLPLKPQPYSLQMDPAYSIDHQSQYFSYHSGFHLYHKGVYTPP